MAAAKAKFDPADFFTLHDIYLWSTSLSRSGELQRDFKGVIQTMRSVEPELYEAAVEDGADPIAVLRVLVRLGVRSVSAKTEAEQESVLYTLEASFAVEYVVKKTPSDHDFNSFVDFNCVHNAWPFWRQHVYDTLKRASLPVPVIPFFSGAKTNRKKARIKSLSRVGSATRD